MTEDSGFAEAAPYAEPPAEVPVDEMAPEPAEPAEAVSEPQEPAAAPAPETPAGPPQPAEEPPDHVPPPFIPDQGVPGWLRDVIHELHDRLRALERG